MRDAFNSEAHLVADFIVHIESTEDTPWGSTVSTGTEFYYSRGRTDVVGVVAGGDVVAFEAKLERWKDALHQAYRNTCFAHRSYVLVPESTAMRASSALADFERRGVGLCYLGADGLVVVQESRRVEPVQPWLSVAAAAHVAEAVDAA